MRYQADPPTRRVHPRGNKIGVPRTLAFDELRVFFDELLLAHGFEVVVSGPSNARTLEMGLERCIDEVCFPLKTFFGHVQSLLLEEVDTVLVPRLISLAKGRNLCPKFHLLPDLIEQSYPEINVIAPYVDLHHSRRDTLEQHLADICEPVLVELGAWCPQSRDRIETAWRKDNLEEDGADLERTTELTVAVLGHLYAERDSFLGMGVARQLKQLGVSVVRSPSPMPPGTCELEKDMYYESNVHTARSIEYHLAKGVDGIVLLTYFACGPDSYGAETMLYRLKNSGVNVPVLRLILDEQTSAEGLATRLGTFVDVARHRKEKRGTPC
jgi:predicted nucleotide-binding protein (sugar kinase/HSP70/actin superfamily)